MLAACAGLALALSGALKPLASASRTLPPGVAARVNGREISREDLAAAATRLFPSDSAAVSPEQLAEALRFLIDEELLVQRAVELRLANTDRTIRSAIVMGMIDTVVADTLAHDPSAAELRDYHASHRALFSRPPRWHVRHMQFSRDAAPEAARIRADDARAAVAAGLPFAEVRARFGAGASDLPDAPVPVHVLRRHLGPALTALVCDMAPGTLADLLETPDGFHVIEVIAVWPETPRPFATVADVVRREYIRRARDAALDDLLAALRARADIRVWAPDEAQPMAP